jgi:transcriptional regulator with XRE-family HTH domain
MAKDHKAATAFSALLSGAMHTLGLSIDQTAERSGRSYEHIRKLVNGEALPSPLLVEKLAQVTGVPVAHAQQAAERDKLMRQYTPETLAKVTKTSARLERFRPLLEALTDEQADAAHAMLQGLVNSKPRKTVVLRRLRKPERKQDRS